MPTGDLLDEFLDAPPVNTRRRGCAVGRVLTELDAPRAEKLRAMLDDPNYTNPFIARGLTAAGYRMVGETVRNHRAKGCSCA